MHTRVISDLIHAKHKSHSLHAHSESHGDCVANSPSQTLTHHCTISIVEDGPGGCSVAAGPLQLVDALQRRALQRRRLRLGGSMASDSDLQPMRELQQLKSAQTLQTKNIIAKTHVRMNIIAKHM